MTDHPETNAPHSTGDHASETGGASIQLLKKDLLGHVWVDSGHLIVTDPQYLEELDSETIEMATTLKNRASLVLDGMAAAVRLGIRNGRYPVYVTKFPNGAVAKIEIVLDEAAANQ